MKNETIEAGWWVISVALKTMLLDEGEDPERIRRLFPKVMDYLEKESEKEREAGE